jgi:5-formyltetrahydrofolate cyclo-ligase
VADEPVACDEGALVLMPGLAFDPQGHRIGYGGGFYDKFLAKEPNHPTLALCYDFQMLQQLETEEFDIPVDLVLWA